MKPASVYTKQHELALGMMLKRFLLIFAWLFGILILGTVGYMLIEGWSYSDAAYMTVITIATVGYREVGELSEAGRIFTSILIFIGVAVIAVWSAVITTFLVSSDFNDYFRRKKMIDKISKMRSHTVICGGGNTGIAVVQELLEKKVEIVMIETSPDSTKYLEYKFPQIAVVQGNATSEEMLWIANIKAAKNLIVALDSDVDNLFVVITARDLNPNLFIIARALDESTAHRILKAGANEVVSPH